MKQTAAESGPSRYIQSMTVNGLHGRYMSVPYKYADQKGRRRNILFIYGQHSSLERWYGLIDELSNYGTVTAPDLPGYGGMDSVYKIGKEPTFDELADYLADYIKKYYPVEQFCLLGLSIGFAIVTRMLQRHPELQARVSLLVSVVGLAHHDDFVFTKRRQLGYSFGSWFFLHRPLDVILSDIIFNPIILRRVYHRSLNAKEKFENLSATDFKATMDMELELWKINDIRTWMRSNIEMFRLDNTAVPIALDVLHLGVRKDRYFDPKKVAKHYRKIFRSYTSITLPTDSHGPSVIATAEEAKVLIPPKLVTLLKAL